MGRWVDVVYPGFSLDDQAEFDHALQHDAIGNHEQRFEAGLQQEWIATIIDNADRHVELLPRECLAEYLEHLAGNRYLKARMLLVQLDKRILRGARLEYRQDLRVHVLDSPDWQYDKEYGLRLVNHA